MCSTMSEALNIQSLQPINIHKDSEFVVDILNKFIVVDVGNVIRQNEVVQVIGYQHYLAIKAESSKEVIMEMRELSRLFLCFKSLTENSVSFEEM